MSDLDDIRGEVKRLHDRIGRIEHFRTGLVGERGDNGTVGRMGKDLEATIKRMIHAEHRINDLDRIHWKVMTLATLGAGVGGTLAKFMPF